MDAPSPALSPVPTKPAIRSRTQWTALSQVLFALLGVLDLIYAHGDVAKTFIPMGVYPAVMGLAGVAHSYLRIVSTTPIAGVLRSPDPPPGS